MNALVLPSLEWACDKFALFSLLLTVLLMMTPCVLIFLTYFALLSSAKGAPTDHSGNAQDVMTAYEERTASPPLWDLNLGPNEQQGARFPHHGEKHHSPNEEATQSVTQAQAASTRPQGVPSKGKEALDTSIGQTKRVVIRDDRPKLRVMTEEQRQDYLRWRERRKSKKLSFETLAAQGDSKTRISAEQHHLITTNEKRPETVAPKAVDPVKKYYAEARPPYVPPKWMGEEVSNYFKHWNNHADEVRKYNQNKGEDRPKFETTSVSFVLQHALDRKEQLLREDYNRKLRREDSRTEEQKGREIDEWHMIRGAENMRIGIQQLHR
jgi:hypothetical protein